MNDIERLASVLRENRQPEGLPTSGSDEGQQDLDVDLPKTLGRAERSIIRDETHASNDTLLTDLVTDFGLAVPDSEESSSVQQVPAGVEQDSRQSVQQVQIPASHESAGVDQKQDSAILRLPLEKLNSQGFITPATKRGLITEQYRRIKRPLLQNLRRNEQSGESNNVIMVTSSVAGEGKTFTSINLAMSLALEREKTVLLIDADVLKNTAGGVLDVDPNTPGLTDLLIGDVADPAEVILRTDISNFTYLPSGRPQQNTNELLSSARMRTLFDDLSNRYHDRIVVLDCPPILQTNEATVLSDYAGQVVFVIAEEDTRQSYVLEALSQISKDNYIGLVLNKSRKRFLGNDYGYTYEYG